MSKERLRFEDYLLLALLIVLFLGLSVLYNVNQNFSFDQVQMLLKGIHAALTGEFLPFGNEASTMGNLPGMLSSWVIGFPLQLYAHAWSPVIFQFLLRVVAILLFINALCQLFERKIVLIGTFLLALSPWVLYQTMLYNPAYLLFGSTLTLNTLVRLRNDSSNRRAHSALNRGRGLEFNLGCFINSLLLVLASGVCLQLHFSWPVLAAMVGIMWLRRDIKISYVGVLVGMALVGWSLVPYVQEIMVNPSLLTNPEPYAQERYLGYGIVHVYPVLKGLLYWFRFGSLLVTEKAIVPELTDDLSLWLVVLGYAWIGIASLVGGLSVLYAAYSNYFVISRFHVSNSSDRLRFVRGMSISAILAVLLAAGASPVVLNFWQIAVIIPFALLPVLAFMSVRPHGLKLYVWVAAIFFVFANALGATYSEKFSYQQNFSANFYRTCLVGFSPQQCSPYGTGLTAEQREVIAAQTPQDLEVIKRVIGGIIPHYEEILQQQQEAKAQEQAQAQEAQTQTESADQSGEVTVREAITEPAVPVVEGVTAPGAAPAAEPAASAPAASAPDASADEQAAPAADTAASASIEESSPASVVQVAPASEPIVIAVPTASGSQNSGSNANSSGSSNSEPLIIDQGQGASGELVIH